MMKWLNVEEVGWIDAVAVVAQLEHAFRWTTRSVLRGIGPSRQSHPLDMSKLLVLELPADPIVT